jgi:molecular chaperone DnaK
VYYPGLGNPAIVGEAAWTARHKFPERVIACIKWRMGEVGYTRTIDGVDYTPLQVSAEILKQLKREAESCLGEDVHDVVITIPSYFGHAERVATMEAGQLAGLNVLALLHEPLAAALAFTVEKVTRWPTDDDAYVLVYDLGGTFSATLIHVTVAGDLDAPTELRIEEVEACKDGNRFLGGMCWDQVLFEIVAEQAMQRFNLDMCSDARKGHLLDLCEGAKRQLSLFTQRGRRACWGRSRAIHLVVEPPDRYVEVEAAEFEYRSRDLLLQTQRSLELVISAAATQYCVERERIGVVLSGGSCRMPTVGEMVGSFMGRAPLQYRAPELLVTRGAAYCAHLFSGAPIFAPLGHERVNVPVAIPVWRPSEGLHSRYIMGQMAKNSCASS